MTLRVPIEMEPWRIKHGDYGSCPREPYGAFILPKHSLRMPGYENRHWLKIIAGCGTDEIRWEHVSVSSRISSRPRIPSWDDMAAIKRTFWEPDDVVIQLHVAEANHINIHTATLHLWRPLDAAIPLPPLVAA